MSSKPIWGLDTGWSPFPAALQGAQLIHPMAQSHDPSAPQGQHPQSGFPRNTLWDRLAGLSTARLPRHIALGVVILTVTQHGMHIWNSVPHQQH